MYFINSSLLVRALALLPVVVLFRLMWEVLRCGRIGTTVPLFAGVSANSNPAWGGALAFRVTDLPSDLWWAFGSAKNIGLWFIHRPI